MGCGVLFPKGYLCKSDSDEELEQQSKTHHIVNLETGVVGPATRSNKKEVTEAVFSAGSRQPGRDYVECEERLALSSLNNRMMIIRCFNSYLTWTSY